MGDVDGVAGRWHLVAAAGGDVPGPTPAVRFGAGPVVGRGVVKVELGAGCAREGPWRTGASGSFLAGIGGGSGEVPDRFRDLVSDRSWLRSAVTYHRRDDELVLRDRRGRPTAKLTRAPDDRPSPRGRPVADVPPSLAPAERHELIGVWRPLPTIVRPRAWQSIEFGDDGVWRGSGPGSAGSGPWVAGRRGELLAIHPYAVALGFAPAGGAESWLLDAAHAGFDGHVLVLLDDDGGVLRRLVPGPVDGEGLLG